MRRLVMLRHGESEWNRENRFTGWKDVELSNTGREEARRAGQCLKQEGLRFDEAHTSVLKRAIHTLDIVLNELDLVWIPVFKTWRLNERHYGGLTGLNKAETAAKHGEEQVKIWRRSYSVPPPPLSADHPDHPSHDPRYREVPAAELPKGESLALTVTRVLPYWTGTLIPALRSGRIPLVVAHGNSLRALIKEIEGLSEAAIMELNLPTGLPIVMEFDDEMNFIRRTYLGDPAEIEARTKAVAQQGAAR